MHKRYRQLGFTLIEVMVAISIAAMLVAVSVPAASKIYQSMSYRSAVREVRTMLESAKLRALSGAPYASVLVNPRERWLRLDSDEKYYLPDELRLEVVSAQEYEINGNTGVLRFYSDGTSTGGNIDVLRSDDSGVRLEVGWLLGEVKQHAIAP
ncbi:prepilin-type N-terminal cleavage/methylation domain-containing protein [Gilvimarinus sp. SDUM040013]|uniref:Prepilin-type N-terminal cleavage/methylation domain-containing protein n=1 Tax=Gilvimarinus gilvus TaxID=3058038 RepID=A0ABU4RX34_9GAMM|nr:prepilin-type N-terminal cleavage/methylation domain-containing protein [Gilvimarinus sp. SDUM040013]MDO3385246.1 prepilin-type N-terminal cleavage/methylation domain-containing protein [Gilvimarinus sp. SDUM040013]MDX6849229.1 prepilin-type N-terminal cleavage/methylation domain-containing protein [Gilvimarinus sp. SDUM040013]